MQTMWTQIRLRAVRSGSALFFYEASHILVDNKKHTFCDYALQGLINVSSVCIRLGFSLNMLNGRTLARPKKLINSKSLPNYKYYLISLP